jgi:hypothetical protein
LFIFVPLALAWITATRCPAAHAKYSTTPAGRYVDVFAAAVGFAPISTNQFVVDTSRTPFVGPVSENTADCADDPLTA